MSPTILVFDSGIGGLSVLGPLRERLPSARYVYVADDAAFPYGDFAEPALVAHIVTLMDDLIGRFSPDLVVIACHTASTLVLAPLRARFDTAFVGTVPAVKPAAASSRTGLVSVLATPGTVRRDYTKDLIETHGGACKFTLVGSARLAALAEAKMASGAVSDADILAEIAPAFVTDGDRRTDTVVLACTHYPFLRAEFERLAPWPVDWIDPAPAIARQAAVVLGEAGAAQDAGDAEPGLAVFTSGRVPPPMIGQVLSRFGLVAGAESAAAD